MHHGLVMFDKDKRALVIIDTALDAFLQLDPSGTIVGWSPKAEEMSVGRSKKSWAGSFAI